MPFVFELRSELCITLKVARIMHETKLILTRTIRHNRRVWSVRSTSVRRRCALCRTSCQTSDKRTSVTRNSLVNQFSNQLRRLVRQSKYVASTYIERRTSGSNTDFNTVNPLERLLADLLCGAYCVRDSDRLSHWLTKI